MFYVVGDLISAMSVLCVAAHPDDEVLGAGATLARHVEGGDDVHVCFLSDGVTSRYDEITESARDEIRQRRERAERACSELGVESVSFHDFPDNQFDSVPLLDIVQTVEAEIDAVDPTRIYTHHYGDLNIDHELTARAVATAARPLPDATIEEVLLFPTLSSSEWSLPTADNAFQPTTFVNVDGHEQQKIDALGVYETELREHPHPRSRDNVERALKLWGSTAGLPAAEPFELLRSVER
jgi:LmbE family N-acetylglucosaminyl deacetylase